MAKGAPTGDVVQLQLLRLRRDQWDIIRHPAKVKVLAMGRRWGKSVLGQCVAIPAASKGARVAWVVPNYKNGRPLWRMVERAVAHLKKAGLVRINRSERTVEFPSTGGFLAIYSMDNPDSIRGENFHLVVIDEAAMISAEAWTDCIQPTLADNDGDVIIISTPKGRNWFYDEYQRGLVDMARAREDPNYVPRQASFHAPTSANPNPNIRKAFELVKEKVPLATYRQEWCAEFLEDGGTVFRHVKKLSTAQKASEWYESVFVLGGDWGKENDYSVFTVRDVASGKVVDWDRFNKIGWDIQRGRLAAMMDRWKVAVALLEENSIGGPNIELLQAEGFPVVGFNTNSSTKPRLIQSYELSQERSEIDLPDDDIFRAEHMAYEGIKNEKTGRMSYGAPEGRGQHDDTVMSGALSDWARLHLEEYLVLLYEEDDVDVERVVVRSS